MAKPGLTNANSVSRTIQFYRIYNDDVANSKVMRKFLPGPLCEAVARIEKSPTKYSVDVNDVETTCWLENPSDDDRLVVASIKRKDFPLTELRTTGVRGVLTMLADQGLAEIVHVRFFKNNIVGIDYNHYGPRASRFKYFCQEKFKKYKKLQIERLIDVDTLGVLRNMTIVRRVDIRTSYNSISQLKGVNKDYIDALETLADAGSAGTVDVALSMEKRNEVLDAAKIKKLAMAMFQNRNRLGEHGKIIVSGLDAKKRPLELNLLEERIVSTKRVLRIDGNARTVDSKDAFRAIGEAYNEVIDRIEAIPISE